MRKYVNRALGLATSNTAKDTYILFGGNVFSAFLGFVFTLFVARALTVTDFGVFSAATNLIVIIYSLGDLGLAGGMINYVALLYAQGKKEEENKYLKATFVLRLIVVSLLSLAIFLFARTVSTNLLATEDVRIAYWVAAISFGYLFEGFFTPVLQAEKRFSTSIIVFNSLGLSRALIVLVFFLFGTLSTNSALSAFFLSTFLPVITGFWFTGVGFLLAKVKKEIYINLVKFSGWLGVNRIISSFSGRLDIQMLASMSGAAATGLYSIPSRLASFIIVLASSFSSVLSPRFAAFGGRKEEKKYLGKALLATIGITLLVVTWIIIAKPFILILFGSKYLEAVPVFQSLAASMIPFLFAIPSVTAIIYALKKPIYIGLFSFFQLAAMFFLNLYLIPKFGVFGPTITYAIANSILALYSWAIVIKYYWVK